MDYEGSKADGGKAEGQNLMPEIVSAESAAKGSGAVPLLPNADNVVVLPEGVSLDDLAVRGRDLVVELPDGRSFVIPDGAVFVPVIVIDDVAVPPLNLAAYLTGAEPQPAAGEVPSSGGNFAEPEGNIQDAYALGDLLPYTELAFPQPQQEEIIPGLTNQEPDIVIEIDDSGVGVINAEDAVNEAGLPERDGEPAGTGELLDDGNGTNNTDTSESTYGYIQYNSPDGVAEITLNGVAITAVGQTFVTDLGVLTITSIEPGRIGYDYVLTDNTTDPASEDNFAVTITDTDGDMATATLRIDIIDDAPIGTDDANTVPAGTFGPVSGNVIENDIPGADGFSGDGATAVTGFSNDDGSVTGEPGDTIVGDYGELTLNADGSYSYTRYFNTPGGVQDHFLYDIVDKDGSEAQQIELTINIGNKPTDITFVPDVADSTEVQESHLPPTTDTRTDEPQGSMFDGNSEQTSGTVTFVSPDGVGSVTIENTPLDIESFLSDPSFTQVVSSDATGTLTITDYTYDPATGEGTISYTYLLNDNTGDPDFTAVPFDITVTDLDGQFDTETLTIKIIDDVPTAIADSDSVTEDGPLVADGNVLTGSGGADANATDGVADTQGADGAAVAGVVFGDTDADLDDGTTVNAPIAGTYGSLTIDASGNYAYTLDNANPLVQGLDSTESLTETFTYTIKDGDGDLAHTTLTITINGANDPVVINGINVEGPDLIVDEDDLADGSDTTKESLTDDNSFTVEGVDGISSIKIEGVEAFIGQKFTTAHGEFEITDIVTNETIGGDPTSITVSYKYTLTDNTVHADANGQNSLSEYFDVDVTDTDGSTDTATIEVRIIDDVPQAYDDDATQSAENADVTVNVLADNGYGADVPGADGVAFGDIAVVGGSLTGAGTLDYNGDGTFTYHPADGEVGTVSFDYTITDGDKDVSQATVTITLIEDSTPTVTVTDLTVSEEGLPTGTDSASDSETDDSGVMTITTGGDTLDKVEVQDKDGNWVDVTAATVGTPITVAGTHGTLSVTSDGAGHYSYSYTLEDNYLTHPDNDPNDGDGISGAADEIAGDSFAVRVTDSDGSLSSTDSIDVTVQDDAPLISRNGVSVPTLVTDDTLTPGDTDSASFAGLFTKDFGADGFKDSDDNDVEDSDAVTYALGVSAPGGVDSGLVDTLSGDKIYLFLESGQVVGRVGLDDDGGANAGGAIAFTISVNTNSGVVTLEQDRAVVHNDSGDPVESGASAAALSAANLVTLTATITDGDGDTDTAVANIGGAFTFEDDGPAISRNGVSVPTLTVDESNFAIDASTSFTGLFTKDFGADGFKDSDDNDVEDSDAVTYALGISSNGVASGLVDTLTGQSVILVMNGGVVEGRTSGSNDLVFTVSVNANTGEVTLNQSRAVVHDDPTDPDEATSPAVLSAASLITLTATITDGDGDTNTAVANIGGAFAFRDDGPMAIDPDAITNTLFNKIGGMATASLDIDDDVSNNFGADGPGTITFANITSGVTDSGLNHDGQDIILFLENNDTVAVGKALVNGVYETVFTITLNQDTSDYDVVLTRTVDDGSGAFFEDLSGGVAGNPPFKLVASTSADALELLFTPRSGTSGDASGSINSDTDDLGVNGQFIGIGKGVSVDFGDFTYVANGGGTSDDRWIYVDDGNVNGFRFTIDQISQGTTTDIRLQAYDYTLGTPDGLQQQLPDPTDYTQEDITSLRIYDPAGTFLYTVEVTRTGPASFDMALLDSDGVEFLTGTNSLSYGGITYSATNSGGINIFDIQSDYKIETYTADTYDRITIDNIGTPSTTDGKFSISELQIAQTDNGDPQNLLLDLQITDGDGDSVLISDALDITIQPAALEGMLPIVLDLDGDGAEFLGLEAGVSHNYGAGLVATAWVGADDGLLAHMTADGLDIVFSDDAAGAATDLEGLRMGYDSNGDGQFTSADDAWAEFGVWQDANSNGLEDGGEFHSLDEMGITGISLVSDNDGYSAADGDVYVSGQAEFTYADGSTGVLADASFATDATMDALLQMSVDGESGGDGNGENLVAIDEALAETQSEGYVDQLVDQFVSDGGGSDATHTDGDLAGLLASSTDGDMSLIYGDLDVGHMLDDAALAAAA